jgi:phage-related protein
MGTEIVTTLIETLGSFVSGIGSAFLNAFQTIFMIETSEGTYSGLNNMGIFLLVMLGISLGYGVIRYITSLFRKEV